ncbi:MAG: hypothetical protein II433_09365, partial [Acidaminococcaceae bacterium]|nr:hypothetical protein [Acidaminococcaceae bacterium]
RRCVRSAWNSSLLSAASDTRRFLFMIPQRNVPLQAQITPAERFADAILIYIKFPTAICLCKEAGASDPPLYYKVAATVALLASVCYTAEDAVDWFPALTA